MSKLYCYSHKNFSDKLKVEQWDDGHLPPNSAFICIGCTHECQEYCGSMFAIVDRFDFEYEHDNVLKVRFDDIDCEHRDVSDEIFPERKYSITGITDAQASNIVKFIDSNIGKDFYIHCNAGKSRSQAIVRYVLDVYKEYDWELNPLNLNYTWNAFVYKKLINAKMNYK